MADAPAQLERTLRIEYGDPEAVEEAIERLKDSYVVTSVYFYVVHDRLQVAANLIHQREIRKQQLGLLQMAPGQRRQ